MKDRAAVIREILEREKFQELLGHIRTIPGCYEDLEVGVCLAAERLGKTQEIIDFIKENSPDPSELVRFCCDIDPDCPKPFED